MNVEVLISCMYQEDFSIISRTNVQSDVVVINQCNIEKQDEFYFINKIGQKCRALFISTKERGLSKSRNMALRYASGDICLICDDDELLEDNYVDVIKHAFNQYTDTIIAFKVTYPRKSYKNYSFHIGYFQIGKISSVQIAFNRKNVSENNIIFNESMGSGTGNGAGEENRFLMDCYKKKLGIRYVPYLIGKLNTSSESQWFHGYNREYWINQGWQSKMIFGRFFGYLHFLQAVLKNQDDRDHSVWQKIKWANTGFFLNR